MMLDGRSLPMRALGAEGGCDHFYPALAGATETGYYVRCPNCEALGPERSSPEAAQHALLVLGARTGYKPLFAMRS